MAKRSNELKRYNLALPTELFEEIQNAADKENTTVVEMLRKFIKIGLLALDAQEKPGSALVIREGDTERQILIF